MEKAQGINWNKTIQQTYEQMQAIKTGGNAANVIDNKRIRQVAISDITPDPEQPRKHIDHESQDIQELAASIKAHGFINFITVRQKPDGKYIIVSGERRFVAAQVVGLEKIPVMVLAEEKPPLEYAVLQIEENLQRKDLSPIEEAEAYERLHREFGVKQNELAEMIKKDKGYVSKMLRLVRLPQPVKDEIRANNIPVSKEVLINLANYPQEEQTKIWEKIKSKPTELALQSVAPKQPSANQKTSPPEALPCNPEDVLEALKRIIKQQGKEAIFEFISPAKVKKLLQIDVELKTVQSNKS